MASTYTTQTSKKVVLITGATGGIGAATAITFAKEGGYELALQYHSANQEKRDALSNDIKNASEAAGNPPVKVSFFQADMGSYDAVRKLHQDVVGTVGEVDILFNNAGSTGGVSGVQSLADVDIDVFEKTWRVNTGSAILLTQLCLPHMENKGWGRIIFCSSVAAFTGGFVGPHYASSKSAQHGFMHWLAMKVAKKGVTVNAVAPAMVGDTDMMGSSGDEALQRRAEQSLPVGRLGRPEEIAETVMWMVRTGFVTNKVVGVDGGMYAY